MVGEDSIFRQLLSSLEARVEQAAYRGYKRAMGEQSQADEIGSEEAARLLGRVRADGSANLDALKSFMQRHPVPHRKAGRKLVFSRAELTAWIDERGGKRR